MIQELKIFNNEQFGLVRTAFLNGEVMFAATDVAKSLGYANPNDAVIKHCKTTGVAFCEVGVITGKKKDGTPSIQNQQMKFITKGNVIRLVANSTLPQAEKVESWIFDEVIPSVLNTGGYIAAGDHDTPEEIMARALLVAQDTLKRKEQRLLEAQKKIEEDAPKVLFANAVSTSQRSCLIAELAKILQQNGVHIGQNRLFEWMRINGYLCQKGDYYNQPTQRAMEMGLFEIKQTTITKPDGTVFVKTTSKVSGKGQIYFVNRFLSNNQRLNS